MTIAIIVHGGASTIEPGKSEAYLAGCRAALEAGWQILERGGDALAAVEAAIRSLEDDPTFNAALGAVLNADGEVETDAAVMEGGDLRFGALGAARGLRHPISVARTILDVGPLLLSGEGALRFAEGQGAELCDPSELITDEQRRHWQEQGQKIHRELARERGGSDTVGCVALDARGTLVVGTSTGGDDHKPPGRIGDSALAGCGFYADNTLGACAATGSGEAIMQVVLAKSVVELLAAGLDPDTAAEAMIDMLGERVKGEGGCIVLGADGQVGWAHNSPDMPCAYRTGAMDQPVVAPRKGGPK